MFLILGLVCVHCTVRVGEELTMSNVHQLLAMGNIKVRGGQSCCRDDIVLF